MKKNLNNEKTQSNREEPSSPTRARPVRRTSGIFPLHGSANKKATKKQLLTAFGCSEIQYSPVLFTLYEIFRVL